MNPALDILHIFDQFKRLRVLIVGDIMVDSYIHGKVERVSPEAPVPVVDVTGFDHRLGGAGNVALNIKALGAIPILCSVIGSDKEGEKLKHLLDKEGINQKALVFSAKRKTTTKTRVIGNQHQLLRIDHEDTSTIDTEDTKQLFEKFEAEIASSDVVIFEDYNKGVLHSHNISKFIEIARSNNKPTVVDPKKDNFLEYCNTTLFKPNLKELKEGLNKSEDQLVHLEDIQKALIELENHLKANHIMVTLSERGVLIGNSKHFDHCPAHIRNIADVSGAGDTVIAVASLCVALGLEPRIIAELSNLAGGLVCEKRGVVPINKEQLKEEAFKIFH
jgi:D-glycero-beta-D-manno-heptose-7-phosphate kinase